MAHHSLFAAASHLIGVGALSALLCATSAFAQDGDGDGVPDSSDNCPLIANPKQTDCDANGVGDVCDIAAGADADCDSNGTLDRCDIYLNGAADANQNCVPDACESAFGDFDLDGSVGSDDISVVLASWGLKGSSADLSGNGVVDGDDLATLLSNWGDSPFAKGNCNVLPWATTLEHWPDPAVVTNESLRNAIIATGYPWRVRDDSSQIEMLLVPGGTFEMGCIQGSNQYGCFSQELPVHIVTLTNAYYIGRYEVTQAQWQAKMGSNPSYFQDQSDSPSRPVEQVSWNTIQNFLAATGLRLPSDAEWEFACRAGTTTPFHSMPGYPNGTTDDTLVTNIAWYYYNTCEGGDGCRTHAVGGKAANALGLHDMSGNVWEWVNDWYADYSSGAQVDPTGPISGSYRVLCGGGWYYDTNTLRSSYRSGVAPDLSYDEIGFRVARAPQ